MNRRAFLALGAAGAASGWTNSPASRTALAAGGAFVLEGRRTFPLVLYQPPNLAGGANPLRSVRDAGFDILHSPPTPESLAALSAQGLHAWCSVGSIASNQRESDRQRIAGIVKRIGGHPALAYWETEDEPSYQWKKPGVARVGPGVIRETYAWLRKLDPSRLVYLNHSPTNLISTLQAYNPGGDIIATDVYPVIPHGIREQYALWPDGRQGDLLNTHISQVGDYARKMRAVAGPDRALFMVLQAFAWEMLRDAKDRGSRMVLYPTGDQLRFMACQCIVQGANGLVWWGLRFTPAESSLWVELAAVAKLLSGLREELASPPRAFPLRFEYHDTGHSLDRGVEWIAKASPRSLVWIAVNADPNQVEVTVRGFGSAPEVVWGARPDRVQDGWRMRFAPFGVSIWRFQEQQ